MPMFSHLTDRTSSRLLLCGSLLMSAAVLAGCGGSKEAPPVAQTVEPEVTPAVSVQTAPPAATVPANSMVSTNASKTQWIGGIPYDVFYDAPLTVASNATQIGSAGTPGSGVPVPAAVANAGTPTTPAMTTPMPAATAGAEGGINWAEVAPLPLLLEESKQIRNRLSGHLNTVATYNKGKEDISQDANVLAALAGVVEVHPEEANWKDKAKIVRDLSYDMYIAADGTGSKPFNATQIPFEQIEVILSGGAAPEKESVEKAPFADVADRTQLMYRIRKSFDNLRSNVNTEARLTEENQVVQREFAVLGMIGSVISTTSYEYAESPEYKQYVKNFIDATVAGREAAAAKNYTAYAEAIATIQKSCGECHGKFAFGDGGF